MAHIRQLHQAATTAYGAPFITTYDLFLLTKSKLKPDVRYEVEEIAAHQKTVDLKTMAWGDAEDIISDAWGISSRRPRD